MNPEKIQINPQRLTGNWKDGWALDLHTISSQLLPDGTFNTTRTEIGELLYQLKYRFDRNTIEPIAETASAFLKTKEFFPYLEAIIPVPPSNLNRPFQPVQELAIKIGEKVNLNVALDYLIKTKETKPLKEIEDTESRKYQLKGAFKIKDDRFAGKFILLFDDLFRSGETLMEITSVLLQEGKVKEVYVLCITKTRTKR